MSAPTGFWRDFFVTPPPGNPPVGVVREYADLATGEFYIIDSNGHNALAGVASDAVVLPAGEDIGSGGNAYVVNPTPAVEAVFGASFTFTTEHASTGPATMNASGTGVKNLRTLANTPFTGTEINSGGTQIYQATYDGTEWLLAGTLAAGTPANPAGTLNLAGTYVIGVPLTGNNKSAGLTFLSTGIAQDIDRNMLNFVWVPSIGGSNLNASFGFDGDDVFILTGTMQSFAIEISTEIFKPLYVYNQVTGDDFLIQSNNSSHPGDAAIVVYRPIGGDNARLWEINATTGLMLSYGGIPTVSNGSPAEYATVDLTGQTAAKTTTTLYTPTATGMFRISVYAKVTTVDGASSSLGGSTGLTIGYADGTDSVAQTLVAQLATQAGASAIVNAGNTTATKLLGSVVIFAKTGVAITYAFDYTSGTPAAMAYELHLKAEAL